MNFKENDKVVDSQGNLLVVVAPGTVVTLVHKATQNAVITYPTAFLTLVSV